MISSLGIPCSKLTPEIFFWKVNFSSKKNSLDGSIFPVVLFLLVQFIDLMTPRAQSLVNIKEPPFYFNNVGLFDLTTPLPIAITMRRPIAVSAARVPIIMVFIFFMKSSLPILFLFHFEFQVVAGSSNESVLWINLIESLNCCFGSMN